MSRYRQLSAEERIQIATLRYQNLTLPQIARVLARHRVTIWREVQRNRAPYDDGYRSARAHERTVARRKRSRRHQQFGPSQISRVEGLLRQQWSPEQVAGYLRRGGEFSISHETIYRHVWRDLRWGGGLHVQMRGGRASNAENATVATTAGAVWQASGISASDPWKWKAVSNRVTGRSIP